LFSTLYLTPAALYVDLQRDILERNRGQEIRPNSSLRTFPGNVSLTLKLEDPEAVASLIDHTLLHPKSTSTDIDRVCDEARERRFASVCINPYWVKQAAESLRGSPVKVCTVIGFPLGANASRIKRAEADAALEDGALELDMVLNIGALRSGQLSVVLVEIRELAAVAHSGGAILKVILETCLLDQEAKVKACELAVEAGADFVKTSTGFSTAGATAADVALMRKTVGETVGVKASGGIRTLGALREMVAAGASRIGTSSGVQIVEELHHIHLATASDRGGVGSSGY
jgi:deoxyribose-phosphate aldolase